jgi:hypothetical protein
MFKKYHYGDEIKKDEIVRECCGNGRDENRASVGKPEGKRLRRRHRRRSEDNIKVDLEDGG